MPAATIQPGPLLDPSAGVADARNWSITGAWTLRADAVSGLYVAKLVRQYGTTGQNQIPFFVRNEDSISDIVFQALNSTWQAYSG